MKPDVIFPSHKNGNGKEDNDKIKRKITDEDKKVLNAFEEGLN